MRNSASVYRFRDRVAVSLPDGPTQYFSRAEAAAIAKAIGAVNKELKAGVSFGDSLVKTVTVPVAGGRP